MTDKELLRRILLEESTNPLNIPEMEDIITEPEDILESYFHVEKEIENG